MRKIYRILNYYESVAHKEHGLCENCDLPIMHGDRYAAEVRVSKSEKDRKKWFRVVKYHPGCPVNPDDDLYFRSEISLPELSLAA